VDEHNAALDQTAALSAERDRLAAELAEADTAAADAVS
jgi:hypothetical protein